MSYLSTDEAYDYATLACWYQNSIDETIPPIWTDEHLEELLKDFYVIPKDTPTADVVPRAMIAEIFGEIDALFARVYDDASYSSGELGYDIEELKKKYTEQ